MSKARVLIADGDPMLQDLLALTIEQDPELEVVARVGDGRAAVQHVDRLIPDLVLIDDRLPVLDGFQVLERILTANPEIRVLVMTGAESDETAVRAFRLGAKGYLPKRGGLAVLRQAIRSILQGEAWMERRLSGRLIEELAHLSRRAEERPEDLLSPREREVLALLGRGMTNAEIGRELFVSPFTVKIHVSSILRKLNVPNRTEAAVLAMKRGLLPDEPQNSLTGGSPTAER